MILGCVPCGCEKVSLWHYHLCPFHQGIQTIRQWMWFYPKYWTSAAFRKQVRNERELHQLIETEITKEIDREILQELFGELKR